MRTYIKDAHYSVEHELTVKFLHLSRTSEINDDLG